MLGNAILRASMAFHVPEWARLTDHPAMASTAADGNNGAFYLPSPEAGWCLALICSDGEQWEHVSVHAFKGRDQWAAGAKQRITLQERTPTWKEMAFVKDLCWDPEDVVMQLHPRRSEYVNAHPHTLHLWRPIDQAIPTPPAILVGPPPEK